MAPRRSCALSLIDQKLHAIARQDLVALLARIQRHLILQTRAAAFRDSDTQAFPFAPALRFEQGTELLHGVIRHFDHVRERIAVFRRNQKSKI